MHNDHNLRQKLREYKRTPGSFILMLLVMLCAAVTFAVLFFLIAYILINGVPNLRPELFAWTYTSENASMMPSIINTLVITFLSLLIAVPGTNSWRSSALPQRPCPVFLLSYTDCLAPSSL